MTRVSSPDAGGTDPAPSAARRRAWAIRDRVRVAARAPTASSRVLPDYLIIGAQKSGTTTLHLALARHPAVALAYTREVHYFDRNFDRGVRWYRCHFPTRARRERVAAREGAVATGEKSPSYLFCPDVPARVRELLPDVRLVVLLRDPVSRAFSHYHHLRRRGREPLSFEDAITRELEGDPEGRSYLGRGRYAEQLERWLARFDREQIHVELSERFFADPARTLGAVQRFIGVPPLAPPDLRSYGRRVYEPMPATLRRELEDHFSADVSRLTRLLGEDPGWWQPRARDAGRATSR